MKGSVKGSELAKAVAAVRAIVNKRSVMPVLSGVLLKMTHPQDSGMLTVHGTNLEQSLEVQVPCDVQEGGSVVVNAERFTGLAKELAGDVVKIATGENHATNVTGGGGRFKLAGMDPVDYPAMLIPNGAEVKVKGASLAAGFKAVEFCSDVAEASQYACVRMLVGTSSLDLAATNGHRLSWLAVPREGEGEARDARILVPTDAVKAITSTFSEADDLAMVFGENALGLVMPGVRYLTRLREGNFPDLQRVIPVDPTHRFSIPRKEFQDALRRAILMTEERPHPVQLTFTGTQLTVRAAVAEAGEAEIELPVDVLAGGDVSVGFNAKYLLEWVSHVPTEKFEAGVHAALAPMVFSAAGAPGYVCSQIKI